MNKLIETIAGLLMYAVFLALGVYMLALWFDVAHY